MLPPREEEEGRLRGSTGWAATEPLRRLWGGSWHMREGQTSCAAELLMGTPPAPAGAWGGRRAAELGTDHGQICLARGGAECGALTDVGVLQEAADPGFSFQLLVI